MPILRPFFSYFGAKFRMARKLGMPQRDTVVEPFAGSACYSCYWSGHIRKVILIDADPLIVSLWRYLTRVREQEIMKLPVHIDSLDGIKACQEAKWLIGFWFNKGLSRPAINRSHWSTSDNLLSTSWSEPIRQRIAVQLKHIRHWEIREGSYISAPKIEAHWHIDPPYQKAGQSYKHNEIDYDALGRWCRKLKGFGHVCENSNANWLPFVEFANTNGAYTNKSRKSNHSKEVVFQFGQPSLSLFNHHADEANQGEDSDDQHRKRTTQSSQNEVPRQEKGGRRGSSRRPSRSGAGDQQIARRRLGTPIR